MAKEKITRDKINQALKLVNNYLVKEGSKAQLSVEGRYGYYGLELEYITIISKGKDYELKPEKTLLTGTLRDVYNVLASYLMIKDLEFKKLTPYMGL